MIMFMVLHVPSCKSSNLVWTWVLMLGIMFHWLQTFTQLKLGLLIQYLPRVAFLPVRYSRLFIWYSVGTKVVELKYTESQTTGSSWQNLFLIVEHKLNSQRKKKELRTWPIFHSLDWVWACSGLWRKFTSMNNSWVCSVYYTRPDHVYAEARSGVSLFTTRPYEALNLTVPTKAEGPHGCLDVRAPGMQTSKG